MGLEKYISSIRSRGISATMILQSEEQLRAEYGENADTIIAGCDTYIYTGGNDLGTARALAERTNESIQSILSQDIGNILVIRRGEQQITVKGIDLQN